MHGKLVPKWPKMGRKRSKRAASEELPPSHS